MVSYDNESTDINSKYEEYGKVYTSYIRKCVLDKSSHAVCINLMMESTMEDDKLLEELNKNLLANDSIPLETKKIISELELDVYNYDYKDLEDLLNHVKNKATEVDKDITFYIFGTTSITNASFEFYELIKRHNKHTITIRHA